MNIIASTNLWRKFCEDKGKWFSPDTRKVPLIWHKGEDWVPGGGAERWLLGYFSLRKAWFQRGQGWKRPCVLVFRMQLDFSSRIFAWTPEGRASPVSGEEPSSLLPGMSPFPGSLAHITSLFQAEFLLHAEQWLCSLSRIQQDKVRHRLRPLPLPSVSKGSHWTWVTTAAIGQHPQAMPPTYCCWFWLSQRQFPSKKQ